MSDEIQCFQCGQILDDESEMIDCDKCGQECCGDCVAGGDGESFCEGCSE